MAARAEKQPESGGPDSGSGCPGRPVGLPGQKDAARRARNFRGVRRENFTLAGCSVHFPTYTPPENADFDFICACGRKLCEAVKNEPESGGPDSGC